jgi:hypothetical protein
LAIATYFSGCRNQETREGTYGTAARDCHGLGWSRVGVRVAKLKPRENPHPQQGFEGF